MMGSVGKQLDFSTSKFCGRDEELKILRGCFRRVKQQLQPISAVWIEGASGVGKTRLIQVAKQSGIPANQKVYYAHGKHSLNETTPFATIADCLGQLVEAVGRTHPDILNELGSDGPVLAKSLVPQLQNFIESDGDTNNNAPGVKVELQSAFERLGYSVRALLRKICQRQLV